VQKHLLGWKILSSIKGTSTIEIKILSYFMLETWKGSCGPSLILGMYHWATMLQATTLKLGEPWGAGLPFYSSAVEAGYFFKHQS